MKKLKYTLQIVILAALTACGSGESRQESLENIHGAAFMGNLEVINQHIEASSDLNIKDQYGSSPLTIAVTFGHTDVALALIDGGADLNVTAVDGSTPLHTAAFLCRTEVVKQLLAQGADLTVRNQHGATAFESVAGSFQDVQPIYDQLAKDLGPLGLKLNYEYLESTRPKIASMIQQAQI